MKLIDEDLLQKVLSLPSDQRTFFIDRLIESLNITQLSEIDALWKDEIEKRVHDIESGKIELIDGETVLSNIRKRFQK